ncbi:hypothetical protein B0H13DRAFT_1916002 [Mycena leptocephala]|nr:hypothetical protein B0H13DRAFT_1916002 [Mycena leptocephala]
MSCMTRETVESDWTRFIVRARRVKELHFSPLGEQYSYRSPPWNCHIFGSDTVLQHLHAQCPEAYMLPALLTLFWRDEVANIHMFFCPSLRSLCLNTSTAHPGVIELISTKAEIITSFEIDHEAADDVLDELFPAIPRMDRLSLFHCDFAIPSKVLAHLSGLTTLQHLGIPLHSIDDPTFFSATSSSFFPSLTNLIVGPSQPTLLCSLLNAISSTSLDCIWWHVTETNPNNILNVLTILANFGSLDSISINAPLNLLGGLPADHLVTMHTLNPLLTLTNLTDLGLLISWLDLGNEDLEKIALHLPLLTNLTLSPRGLVVPPRITLQGLLPVFHHCALRFLSVVIDAGDDVLESEFSLPPRRPSALTGHARRLRFLDFGNSRIGPTKIESVATFLAELFPRLTTLTAWAHDTSNLFADPVLPPSSSNLLWNQVADRYRQLTLHEQSATNWESWTGFNMVGLLVPIPYSHA